MKVKDPEGVEWKLIIEPETLGNTTFKYHAFLWRGNRCVAKTWIDTRWGARRWARRVKRSWIKRYHNPVEREQV